MENKVPIQTLNNLLDINTDRVLIYSLVKNEIIYQDLKMTLESCIKDSLFFRSQLTKEINRIASKESYKADPNQDFFNVWLIINDCLTNHNHDKISSLFFKSEDIFETTYNNALNKDTLKYLSLRHKNLIWKQKELLNAS